MKTISYAKLQKNYAGEYIAREDSRILAHTKKAKLVKSFLEKIAKFGRLFASKTSLL